MELEIYTAFRKAGIEDADARAAVESINKEIDRRYALHSQQLVTRGDIGEIKHEISEMESRLLRALNDMQRWTLGAVFGSMAALAVITKLWH
jgi:hypothetical protein